MAGNGGTHHHHHEGHNRQLEAEAEPEEEESDIDLGEIGDSIDAMIASVSSPEVESDED